MEQVPSDWEYDEVFDASDLGCGEMLADFRMYIRPLPAGCVVLLISPDMGSPREVPAWCRLTGNRLIARSKPYYLIKKARRHQEKE